MTTKKQLLNKIAELQAQVDEMPDDKPVNPVFFPKEGDGYLTAQQLGNDDGWEYVFAVASKDRTQAYFKTTEAAKAYAKAFQTLLDCHAMSDWVDGECWGIADAPNRIIPCFNTNPGGHNLFGRFASGELARNCINKIGMERIERAYKVLCGGAL